MSHLEYGFVTFLIYGTKLALFCSAWLCVAVGFVLLRFLTKYAIPSLKAGLLLRYEDMQKKGVI